MTFTELENAMLARGIRRDKLAINETPTDGQYCIQCDGERTEVFRFERGIKGEVVTFQDKSAAMEHFQSIVLADQTSFLNWDGKIK
jgi:hypothetical protein